MRILLERHVELELVASDQGGVPEYLYRRLPRLSGDQTHLADHLDRLCRRQHRCASLYWQPTGQKNEHVGALIDFRRGGGPSRR